MKRILVVKLADLGDLLTATPALRALRSRFPEAHITALVTPHTAPLLAGNDAVDAVLEFPKARFDHPRDLLAVREGSASVAAGLRLAGDLARGHFDATVLLHHLTTRWGRLKYRVLLAATGAPIRVGLDNGMGTFLSQRAPDLGFGVRHEVDYWLDVVGTLGATHPDPRMELHLTPQELDVADRDWSAYGFEGQEVALLHPGSGTFSVAKRWPAERFGAVADALAAEGLRIGIIAGPGEEPLAERASAAMSSPSSLVRSQGGFRALAALLRRARLFVGNDSGVMHGAATMGVPVVAVFGLSNHRAWGPYPADAHRVVRLDLPCSPCFYTGFSMGTPAGCPPRTCLEDLAPERVIAAARELLRAPVRTLHGGSARTPLRQTDV
jgi:heptosyltransferase-2